MLFFRLHNHRLRGTWTATPCDRTWTTGRPSPFSVFSSSFPSFLLVLNIPRDFHGSKHTEALVPLLSMIIKFDWQTKNGEMLDPQGSSSYSVFPPSPFHGLSSLRTRYHLLLYCTVVNTWFFHVMYCLVLSLFFFYSYFLRWLLKIWYSSFSIYSCSIV